MRIIRDHLYVAAEARGAVAAIGNFDGVHIGHQAVIAQTRDIARSEGAQSAVLTFEPHPRRFFAPDAPPFRLMNAEARTNRLARLGVELLFELSFTSALAALPAEAFARDVLHRGLGLAHVVVGADFRFGHGRGGDAALLARMGRELGFGVTIADLVQGDHGEVSSTSIRQALSDGRPEDAARMLGHWHRIEGPVLRGDQRGRDLGYPTANIALDDLHQPRFGVYAVLVDVLDGPQLGHYRGVASLGVRPMFHGEEPNLEVHLFDFAGDLYGAHLSVALVAFQRPEAVFDGVDALIAQMDADSELARGLLTERA